MEDGVFHRPAVAGELKRFVEARLHLDHPNDPKKNEANQGIMTGYGLSTNVRPSYAVVDARDGKVIETFPGSTRNDAEFAAFLKKANKLP